MAIRYSLSHNQQNSHPSMWLKTLFTRRKIILTVDANRDFGLRVHQIFVLWTERNVKKKILKNKTKQNKLKQIRKWIIRFFHSLLGFVSALARLINVHSERTMRKKSEKSRKIQQPVRTVERMKFYTHNKSVSIKTP